MSQSNQPIHASDYSYGATLLKVSGVSKAYDQNLILRDVELEIKDLLRPGQTTGQVVGLLGPSGMGKTTLFRLLAGLEAPDTGTVLVWPEAKPVQRGMMGVVFQQYPLFAHRTVLGNLITAGKQAGLSGAEAKAKATELLTTFDLSDRAKYYPAQLSGGQRQRVAIAQQFICSHHYLLMDEPFSGLDPLAVSRVGRMIQEVANLHEFNTIVIVTHDIEAALEVADTLWLLGRDRDAQGQIIPGARIQATYNLIERGLTWREDIRNSPEFMALLREIYGVFPNL
ncbi:MAG: ABC transporter ATP-binding protein [Candidatus Sericytochromatia bacterium]